MSPRIFDILTFFDANNDSLTIFVDVEFLEDDFSRIFRGVPEIVDSGYSYDF